MAKKKVKALGITLKELLPSNGKKMSEQQVIQELIKMGIWDPKAKGVKKKDLDIAAQVIADLATATPKHDVDAIMAKHAVEMAESYSSANDSYEICGEPQKTKNLPEPHYAHLVLNLLEEALSEEIKEWSTLPSSTKVELLTQAEASEKRHPNSKSWGHMMDVAGFIKPFVDGKLGELMQEAESELCGDGDQDEDE